MRNMDENKSNAVEHATTANSMDVKACGVPL